ncbi:unnamed protein product [Blepharisma stoltei]|uniref:Uncharacterized protein n=1 Tax=Blepharisma stoltei TaxID=1481888 RepID=A0AAU9JV40_9CILI|nr:unnamed protein product [Blepharisma stoltei]
MASWPFNYTPFCSKPTSKSKSIFRKTCQARELEEQPSKSNLPKLRDIQENTGDRRCKVGIDHKQRCKPWYWTLNFIDKLN